jgi:hypothetical protein
MLILGLIFLVISWVLIYLGLRTFSPFLVIIGFACSGLGGWISK